MSTQNNLPWKEAIVSVLDDAASAMHYTDIAQAIIDQNLRHKVGATPAATVASNITTDIKQLDDKSSFVRVKRAEYMLRKYYNTGAALLDESPGSSTLDEVSEEIGIIQAFGMYWRRNLIRWSSTPKIPGQQSRGAENVNFVDQRGIYLLHDGRETVYVGRSVDRPLGTRLFEHTYDRLNGRWDRFSWFGIKSVTESAAG